MTNTSCRMASNTYATLIAVLLLTFALFAFAQSDESPLISVVSPLSPKLPIEDTVVDIVFKINMDTPHLAPADRPGTVYMNYIPPVLNMNPATKLTCVTSTGTTIFTWEDGPIDTHIGETARPTRSMLTFAQLNASPKYITTPNNTLCTVQVPFYVSEYQASLRLGANGFWGIPSYDKDYGFVVYSTASLTIDRGILPLPYMQPPFVMKTRNNCFGQEFCIFDVTFDVLYFLKSSYVLHRGLGDFYNAGNTTCYSDFSEKNLTRIPTVVVQNTIEHGPIAAVTPQAYDFFIETYSKYLTNPELIVTDPPVPFTAVCVFDSSYLDKSVGGPVLDNLQDVLDPTRPAVSYMQPTIQRVQHIFAHTRACFVGQECEYSLEFSDEFIAQYPLILLQASSPQVYLLKSPNVCSIHQFTTGQVFLQIVANTRLNADEQNRCVITFTPQAPTAWQRNLNVETLNTMADGLQANVTVFLLRDGLDRAEGIRQTLAQPTVFSLEYYVLDPTFRNFVVPFNPIMPSDQHYVAVSLPGGKCSAVTHCEFSYHFYSPVPLASIRTINWLRLTDSTTRVECWDAVKLVATISISPDLEYMYLTPATTEGLTFGYCSYRLRLIFDKQIDVYPHEYILARTDAYPHHPHWTDYENHDYSAVLSDLVPTPAASTSSSTPYGFYISRNSHYNYITFVIGGIGGEGTIPSTTLSNEFEFINKRGPNTFEFSNVNCYIPQVVGYNGPSPSCEAHQNAPDRIYLQYGRQATTLNTRWVTLTFSVGNIAPTTIQILHSVLTTPTPTTGEIVLTRLASVLGLTFPLMNDLGPLLSAPEQSQLPLTIASEATKQTIHLMTGHITPVKFSLSNQVMPGSTFVFQLYSVAPTTRMRTPLFFEFANAAEIAAERGLELLPNDDTCPFCIRFKVLDGSDKALYPELQGDPMLMYFRISDRWKGRKFENINFQLLYKDSFSSWGTMTEVNMAFKVETPAEAHDWAYINGGRVVPHYGTPTYDNAISASWVTYNMDINNVQYYLNGFSVSAAVAGDYYETAQNGSYRQNITISARVSSVFSNDTTLPYTKTVDNATYLYNFKNCAPWTFSTPSCEVLNDNPNDLLVRCNNGAFNNAFSFLAPEEATNRLDNCLLNTTLIVNYFTGKTTNYYFQRRLGFIPAVPARTLAFHRAALVCGSTNVPVFYAPSVGVYKITPPHSDYTVATNSTAQFSIAKTSATEITLTVKSATQVVPIYTTMSCPRAVVSVDSAGWSILYQTALDASMSTYTSVIYPTRGFYISTASTNYFSNVNNYRLSLQPNSPDGDFVMDPNGLPIYTTLFFPTSKPKSTFFQFQPPVINQGLFKLSYADYWLPYVYESQELDAGMTEVLTVRKTVNVKFYTTPTNPTILNVEFADDIDVYRYDTWDVTAESTYREGLGVVLPLIPQSSFDQTMLKIMQCTISTTNCRLAMNFPVAVQPYLAIQLDLSLELGAPSSSTLSISRWLSPSDSIILTFPPGLKMISQSQEYNIDKFTLKLKHSDETTADGVTTLMIVSHDYFPPWYSFKIPTQYDDVLSTFDIVNDVINIEAVVDMYSSTNLVANRYQLPLTLDPHGPVLRAVTHFAFPDGFSFDDDEVAIEFALGREFLFSQVVEFYPLPLKQNHKTVYRDGEYEFELVTIPLSADLPLLSRFQVTLRTDTTIPLGEKITVRFPALPQQEVDHGDANADIYTPISHDSPIFVSSGGLGEDRVSLDMNLVDAGVLSVEEDKAFAYIPRPIPQVNMVQRDADTYVDVCKQDEVCALEFDLLNYKLTDGYSLKDMRYFDIVLTFGSLPQDDEYAKVRRYEIWDEKLMPYHEQTNTIDLYTYRYVYAPNALIIQVDVLPSTTSTTTISKFQKIPIYLKFKSDQNDGILDVAIYRYANSTVHHANDALQPDGYVAENSVVMYHETTVVKGPSVLSKFNPSLFYINGGLFSGEPFTIGVAPGVALSTDTSYRHDIPRLATISWVFTPQENVDGDYTSLVMDPYHSTYESVIRNPFIASRQAYSPLESIDASLFLEARPDHFAMVLKQQSGVPNGETFAIRPSLNNSNPFTPLEAFEFTPGFTARAFYQVWDPAVVDGTGPGPYLSAGSVEPVMYTEKVPLIVREKPWVRVVPTVLDKAYPQAEKTRDVIFMDITTQTVRLEFTNNMDTLVDPANPGKYAVQYDDILTFTIPKFYTVETGTYTCQCLLPQNLCTEFYVIWNGEFFVYAFNRIQYTEDAVLKGFAEQHVLPSKWVCDIPMSVSQIAVDNYILESGKTFADPQLTRAFLDYRSGDAQQPVTFIHDEQSDAWNPMYPQEGKRLLPTLTSFDTDFGTDQTLSIRERYLSFYMPYPVKPPTAAVEFIDFYLVDTPGILQIDFSGSAISTYSESSTYITLPMSIASLSATSCDDPLTGERMAIASTVDIQSCATPQSELFSSTLTKSCVRLQYTNVPFFAEKLICQITDITPLSEFTHDFKTFQDMGVISSNIKNNPLQETQLIKYSFSQTTTERFYPSVRQPKPKVTISGSFIENIATTITFVGEETTFDKGDILYMSLGYAFRPVHYNWHDVYCLSRSNVVFAKVTFYFNTVAFTKPDDVETTIINPEDGSTSEANISGGGVNAWMGRDANPANTDQLATSFSFTYLDTNPITPKEKWVCTFEVTAAENTISRTQKVNYLSTSQSSSKRIPSVFQKRIIRDPSSTDDDEIFTETTVEYELIHDDLRPDAQSSVFLGLVANNTAPNSESTFLLYYNRTKLLESDTPPSLVLSLPTIFTSDPGNFGVTCQSSDPLVDVIRLPLQKGQANSISSTYIIPLDSFLLKSSDELSFVRCFFPLLMAPGQSELNAKLQLGQSTTFVSTTFAVESIVSASLEQRGYAFYNFPSHGYWIDQVEAGVYTGEATSLIFYNNIPTNVHVIVNHFSTGNTLTPVSTTTWSQIPAGGCVEPTTGQEIVEVLEDGDVLTTRDITTSTNCTMPIISTYNTVTKPTNLLPQDCGTEVNPIYCSTPTTFVFHANNAFLSYPSQIYYVLQADRAFVARDDLLYLPSFFDIDFRGLYPGSSLILKINTEKVVLNEVVLALTDPSTDKEYERCEEDEFSVEDNGYRQFICNLTEVNAPFWRATKATVMYQLVEFTSPDVAAMTTSLDIFEIELLQAQHVIDYDMAQRKIANDKYKEEQNQGEDGDDAAQGDDGETNNNANDIDVYYLKSNYTLTFKETIVPSQYKAYHIPAIDAFLYGPVPTPQPLLDYGMNYPKMSSYILKAPQWTNPQTGKLEQLPVGEYHEWEISFILLPFWWESITIPFLSFRRTAESGAFLNTTALETTPYAVFDVPYEDSVRYNVASRTNIMYTTCGQIIGNTRHAIYDLEITIIPSQRDSNVDDTILKFTPIAKTAEAHWNNLHQTATAGELKCSFPLSITRLDLVIEPRSHLSTVKDMLGVSTYDMMDELYPSMVAVPNLIDLHLTAGIMKFVPIQYNTLPNGNTQTVLPGFIWNVPINTTAIRNTNLLNIDMNQKDTFTLSTSGELSISLNRVKINPGDAVVIRFTPTWDESEQEDSHENNTQDEMQHVMNIIADSEYRGDLGLIDSLFDNTVDYHAVLKQKYKLLAPRQLMSTRLAAGVDGEDGTSFEVSPGTPCYNQFWPSSGSEDSEIVGYLFAADADSYRTIAGGISDTFVLNITNPRPKSGAGFLSASFKCKAQVISTRTHLFAGEVTAAYIAQTNYTLIIAEDVQGRPTADELIKLELAEAVRSDTAYQLTVNNVTKLSNPITSALDVKISIQDTYLPSETTQLRISVTTTPTQSNIFVIVNLTQIGFSMFYGCEGEDFLFADFYPLEGGITNDAQQDILRVFFPQITESTLVRCSFAAPVKAPVEYLQLIDDTATNPKLLYSLETRPGLPIETQVFKLLSRRALQTNPYLTELQKIILGRIVAPSNIHQHRLVEYFRLQPLTRYTTYHRTTWQNPIFAETIVFEFIRNINGASQTAASMIDESGSIVPGGNSATTSTSVNSQIYLTQQERNALFTQISEKLALHVVKSMFVRIQQDQLSLVSEQWIVDESIVPYGGYLRIAIAYAAQNTLVSNDPLSTTLSGIHTEDAKQWYEDIARAVNSRPRYPFEDKTPAEIAQEFPSRQLTSESTAKNAILKAFDLTSIVRVQSTFDVCYSNYAAECAVRFSDGMPCYSGNGCRSGYCSIEFTSTTKTSAKSPYAFQTGLTAAPGFCAPAADLRVDINGLPHSDGVEQDIADFAWHWQQIKNQNYTDALLPPTEDTAVSSTTYFQRKHPEIQKQQDINKISTILQLPAKSTGDDNIDLKKAALFSPEKDYMKYILQSSAKAHVKKLKNKIASKTNGKFTVQGSASSAATPSTYVLSTAIIAIVFAIVTLF